MYGAASAIKIGSSKRVVTVPSPGVIIGDSAAWSADATQLAFVAQLSETCALHTPTAAAFVADGATGVARELERAVDGIGIEWYGERTLAIAGDRGVSIVALDGSAPVVLTAGSLTLEPARHEARVGAISLGLTPTEFRLLEALVRAGGDLVAHHRLARAGWLAEPDPDLLWLKPHLARLRSKLEAVGGPRIVAVRSVGYRIEADEPA